ncbi:ABCB family ABC transporter ATP-binding protein/permease [Afifella marina]|uniref:ATP-binding cassette, subfamily B n=1 Tax=Afifella marina DSM 2698 TaxID=1120955 RepID=A0A1G5MMS4_AFIMA|nr:ABC transporter ATP-binding protein/permease [Afifella marina]MBK1623900.1 ABC transporter ATP-binding protein/permease [Afifella marina DSM 2698]MBK1627184.1 ABC transporter ATP-binding protein/permease [Afifella marina]MBK5918787.1 metal ABC transporter permease [Afifella marina]RAI22604.1 metal ABC transporter permease [Afifella marina DSM 2698]SCZ25878.1 ATP-binding cassette, subfamily B [Afifella marina DSM 2698]
MSDANTPAGQPRISAARGHTFHTLRNLWPYMWPADRPDLKKRVLWAVLALLAAKIITVLVPYTFKWVTDALAGEGGGPAYLPAFLAAPVMLVVAYNFGRVLTVAFNQMRDALFARVGQHAVRQLAWKTFRHLHQLSLRFHLARRTGGLSRVIERGTKGIETIVRFTILNSVPTVIEFALTAAVIWYNFSWVYVAIIAVTLWAYVFFTVRASDWRISIRREMNDSDTDANSKAIDSLLNFETVKYFGNEAMETERFDGAMSRYEMAATKTWTSLAWLNFGQTVIFSIGMAVSMILSARAVMAGTQTVGDFVMINALLMQLSVPLNFIGFVYREIKQGLVDIEAMFQLLNVDPEIRDKKDAPPLRVEEGAIAFEHVSFAYDPERPILKNVSFEVPAGGTLAIVGPSGAGKSTISRLLFRFYDVTGGRIMIDGQDLRDVEQDSVRSAIGMVPQDTVLFNDTIGYNIRYGRYDASRDEVKDAARMAQIAGFIESLPEGYDTPVGERGLKLSGGEKQRVAIARTILKGPPILILDEATSALDTATEQDIQTALDRVSQNRTTLVIAHRLSTVVSADQILVLQAGEVVERGTHIELMERGGVYADMWARQREADEAAERLRESGVAEEDYLPSLRTDPEADSL